MTDAGADLDRSRRSVMERSQVGLAKLYDLVSEAGTDTPDIVRLREIHVEIDEAVREAYAQDEDRDPAIRVFEARIASAPLPSWREIDLAHGFHDTPQGPRFTISPQARTDVLDKLLALNHYRHQQELASGLLNKSKKKPRPKPSPTTQHAPALDDGALSPRQTPCSRGSCLGTAPRNHAVACYFDAAPAGRVNAVHGNQTLQ